MRYRTARVRGVVTLCGVALFVATTAIGADAIGANAVSSPQPGSHRALPSTQLAASPLMHLASGESGVVPAYARLLDSLAAAAASSLPALSVQPDVIVGERDGFVDVVVSLSAPSASTVTTSFQTPAVSASSGAVCAGDYAFVSGTLTFLPGETTQVVRVDLTDCPAVEPFESFTLLLQNPTNATLARASGRIGIVDDSTVVAMPHLFVRDAVVDERAGSVRVSVLLGNTAGEASNSPVTVNYASGDGTASAGTDYTAVNGTLTFAPGETAKTVEVPISDDALPEPTEQFALNLSSPAGATISDGSATITIGASDAANSPLPALSVQPDVIVGERDGFVDLVVSLSAPSASTVTTSFQTPAVSASSGAVCPGGDYAFVSGTLTFLPGETTQVVRVDLTDCPAVEPFESFTLLLQNPTNATLARASGRIGIIDDSTVVATPHLFVRDAVVDERAGSVRVSVLLGNTAGEASNSPVTVNYASGDGTASAGTDYTAVNGTLTFAPGETAKTVEVPISDDALPEPTEQFALNLSSPAGATISDGSATITIGASDAANSPLPALSVQPDVIVGERDGFVDLVVSLSAPSASTVTTSFQTPAVSASSGAVCPGGDYAFVSGTLTFLPGETTQVVRVDLTDCPAVEPFESFTLLLQNPTNATLARASGRIGIVDDSTVVATPHLFVRDAVVDERAGSVRVSVLLGNTAGEASNSPVTVNYASGDGTASASTDYTAVNGTLTFAPGETAKTVEVPISDDALPEPTEQFALNLSSPAGATISDGSATITIGASDAANSPLPALSVQPDVIVGERDGFVDLVVSLSAPSASTVTTSFQTPAVSASSGAVCPGVDYAFVSGTLTFLPGETTQVVRVDLTDCPAVEPFESFTLLLQNPTNATLARASGRIGIIDDSTVVATPHL